MTLHPVWYRPDHQVPTFNELLPTDIRAECESAFDAIIFRIQLMTPVVLNIGDWLDAKMPSSHGITQSLTITH